MNNIDFSSLPINLSSFDDVASTLNKLIDLGASYVNHTSHTTANYFKFSKNGIVNLGPFNIHTISYNFKQLAHFPLTVIAISNIASMIFFAITLKATLILSFSLLGRLIVRRAMDLHVAEKLKAENSENLEEKSPELAQGTAPKTNSEGKISIDFLLSKIFGNFYNNHFQQIEWTSFPSHVKGIFS